MNLFLIQICILISRIWTKSYNGEIDEFINKLLNSNKFDELAEKLAEKAARKIFALDQSRISLNIKTQDEEPPNKTKYKTLRDGFGSENFKEKEDKSIVGNEHLNEIKQKAIQIKNEFNRKQTISKNILSSKEQLRLKYKNLKMSRGKTFTNQNILENKNDSLEIHKNRIELTKSEPITKTNEKEHKSRSQKVNNQRKSLKGLKMKSKSGKSSEELKLNEDKNQETRENTSEGLDHNMKLSADKDSEEKERSNSIETIKKDVVNDDESIYDHNNDSNEGKKLHNQTLSVETDNDNLSKEKQMSEDLEPKSHSRDDPYETEKDSYVKKFKDKRKSYSMTTRKLIIRREGDKLFAFENSPDYQEYEEKIARQKFQSKEILL